MYFLLFIFDLLSLLLEREEVVQVQPIFTCVSLSIPQAQYPGESGTHSEVRTVILFDVADMNPGRKNDNKCVGVRRLCSVSEKQQYTWCVLGQVI